MPGLVLASHSILWGEPRRVTLVALLDPAQTLTSPQTNGEMEPILPQGGKAGKLERLQAPLHVTASVVAGPPRALGPRAR